MDAGSRGLLTRAAEFIWSDDVQYMSDTFVSTHAHLFAGAESIHEEQRLEWQQAFIEYRQLYERALEGFCAREQVSQNDFVEACRMALDHSDWNDLRGFAECVLAMGDYSYFFRMMAEAAAESGAICGHMDNGGQGDGLIDELNALNFSS